MGAGIGKTRSEHLGWFPFTAFDGYARGRGIIRHPLWRSNRSVLVFNLLRIELFTFFRNLSLSS